MVRRLEKMFWVAWKGIGALMASQGGIASLEEDGRPVRLLERSLSVETHRRQGARRSGTAQRGSPARSGKRGEGVRFASALQWIRVRWPVHVGETVGGGRSGTMGAVRWGCSVDDR
jgi:hypothetical protein